MRFGLRTLLWFVLHVATISSLLIAVRGDTAALSTMSLFGIAICLQAAFLLVEASGDAGKAFGWGVAAAGATCGIMAVSSGTYFFVVLALSDVETVNQLRPTIAAPMGATLVAVAISLAIGNVVGAASAICRRRVGIGLTSLLLIHLWVGLWMIAVKNHEPTGWFIDMLHRIRLW